MKNVCVGSETNMRVYSNQAFGVCCCWEHKPGLIERTSGFSPWRYLKAVGWEIFKEFEAIRGWLGESCFAMKAVCIGFERKMLSPLASICLGTPLWGAFIRVDQERHPVFFVMTLRAFRWAIFGVFQPINRYQEENVVNACHHYGAINWDNPNASKPLQSWGLAMGNFFFFISPGGHWCLLPALIDSYQDGSVVWLCDKTNYGFLLVFFC